MSLIYKVISALVAVFLSTLSIAKPDQKSNLQGKPFLFIENKGQVVTPSDSTRNDIQYKLSAVGVTVFVGSGQLQYQFTKTNSSPEKETTTYRIDMKLVGSNKNAKIAAEQPNPYFEQYYIPHASNVVAYSYRKITYKNIYPNIDWCLYIRDGKLEYDFIIHPGGNAQDIQLQYEGATQIVANADGSITAQSPMGNVTENKPYSYIKESGEVIASSFKLDQNTLSFKTNEYTGTLVIDPVLDWSTYYGVTGDEYANQVATDNTGSIYIIGETTSTSNLATTGSHQQTHGGGYYDAFLAKYNQAGQRLWSTYFGGTGEDIFSSLAINSANEIIVVGESTSTGNIATVGSHQSIHSGSDDATIAKFNTSGQLLWSSYYGGTSYDRAYGVAVDAADNIYIAGETNSNTNIATVGAFQYSPSLGNDVFVTKFASSGQRIWGTYFGGDASDVCFDITYDVVSNCIYFTGYTTSTNAHATFGAHQTVNPGQNAFLQKFDTSGQRIWGTFYGGGEFDRGDAVCTDALGNVYIGGATRSVDSIATPGSFQPQNGGGQYIGDAFLAKFNTNGQRLWGSYYGGFDGFDFGRDIVCDNNNNVWFSGGMNSLYLNGTQGSLQPVINDVGFGPDIFLVEFNPDGQRLYATYYGSDAYDECFGLAFSNGALYLTGNTASTTGFSTVGSEQSSFGGGALDAFLMKFHMDTTVVINEFFTDTILCQNQQFNVNYSISGTFQTGNTFTLQLSDASGSFSNPVNIGSISSTTSGVLTGTIPGSTPPGLGYRIRIVSSNIAYTSYDNGTSIEVKQTPSTPTLTSNSPVCEGTSLNLAANTSTSGVTYSWSGPDNFSSTSQNPSISNTTVQMSGDYIATAELNGCISQDTTVVTINPSSPAAVSITASPGTSINIGQSVTFTANVTNGNTPTYQWRLNGADIIGETNATYTSTTLANNDIVSVMVHASGTCLIPDSALSNQLTMSVTNNVSQIDRHSQLSLYPNPNKGIFMIEGPFSTDMPNIDAISIIGETTPVTYSRTNDNIVQVTVNNIKSGNYIVRVKLNDKVTYLIVTITD